MSKPPACSAGVKSYRVRRVSHRARRVCHRARRVSKE